MKKNSVQQRLRIYFTGVGGQGTLTATTLLARAAMIAGLDVVAGEVHGMAQRGGVVESVLLLGGWRSPRLDFGEADVLLGFEPLETLRGLPYLRPGGAIFSSSDPLPPLGVSLGREQYPEMSLIEEKARRIAEQCKFLPCRAMGLAAGAAQSGNTALLGAACASGALPFGTEMLEKTIKHFLPSKVREINLKALAAGAAA
ncbi:MAG: indolepyruvate oxidoreductase subunit beta [Desulfovibrio sp.]|jgi:indolepyruvate ferredoxin oxidoreductase beta subunit|nr:indolepyruvate oxidoreductase subunit beta [Desulfovibrio sp.]